MQEETMDKSLIFDTHAHLNDAAFAEDRDAVIASLSSLGIGGFCEIGFDTASSEAAVRLAERFPDVYCAVGIHPENAGRETDADIAVLRSLAAHKKVRAIGEIGLDYHSLEEDIDREKHPDWNANPPKEIQRGCFRKMLKLARELKLPVNIHSRDAAQDTYDLLVSEKGYAESGIVHCFSYPAEMARRFAALGMYVGIGGVLTFRNARKLAEAAEAIPMDRIVLETDCPYMAPEPHRGTRNDPRNLRYVVRKLADIKKLPPEEVVRITTENAMRVYRI